MINIEQVIGVVREASRLMMTTDFAIREKGDVANIVTSSDVAVQDYLCQHLAELLPGCGFLCEEEDEHDTLREYVWIIDPIDGTANYSRGIDQCAISVGLMQQNLQEGHLQQSMLLGVVYLPRTQELFWAEKGRGAWRNGEPIHVSTRTFEQSILCTALAVYHKEYADVCSRIIVEAFRQCNDIRRFGAAAPELCYLAMGRCELYFEYLLSPWDYAAARLILQEAGGHLSNLQAGQLSYTQPSGVLAANTPDNLQRLQSIVTACMA